MSSETERLNKIISIYKRNVSEALDELEELPIYIDDNDIALDRIEVIINILTDFGEVE